MRLRSTLVVAALMTLAVIVISFGCNNDDTSPVTSTPDQAAPVSQALVQLNESIHLVVSNQTSSSATISWVSTSQVDACVYFGLTTSTPDSVKDATVDDIHYATLTGLIADTTYYFKLRTGTSWDNNQGAYYTFHTAKVGAGVPYTAYQNVYLNDGQTPAGRVIGILTVAGNGGESEALSALTDAGGFWYANLGNLKDRSNRGVFSYAANDSIFVSIFGAADEDGFDTVLVIGASPQDLGDLTLGEVIGPCDCIPGDANGDGKIDRKDLTYLTDYLKKDGPAPVPYAVCSGDADCNCKVDSKDIKYLRDYLQFGGDAPCTCEYWTGRCGPLE